MTAPNKLKRTLADFNPVPNVLVICEQDPADPFEKEAKMDAEGKVELVVNEMLPKYSVPIEGAEMTMISKKTPEYMDALEKYTKSNYENGKLKSDGITMYKELIKLHANCVVGWNEEFFGMPCTQENVCKVLLHPAYDFIFPQVQAYLEKQENFAKKS